MPSGVSDRPCAWWRMKSWMPNSTSRCEIAAEMAGCDMCTFSDASVMLSVSPAATKYSICLSV